MTLCLLHAIFQGFASSDECCFVNFCVGLGVPLAGQRGGSARWVLTTCGARGAPARAVKTSETEAGRLPARWRDLCRPEGSLLSLPLWGQPRNLLQPHAFRTGRVEAPPQEACLPSWGPDAPPANVIQTLGWSACLPTRPGSVDMLVHR